jgi:hypothetical protein
MLGYWAFVVVQFVDIGAVGVTSERHRGGVGRRRSGGIDRQRSGGIDRGRSGSIDRRRRGGIGDGLDFAAGNVNKKERDE